MYEGIEGRTTVQQQIEYLSTTFNTAYSWNYEMVRRELSDPSFAPES